MNDFKYPVYATFHAEEKLRGILAMLKKMILQESHTLLITDKKKFLTFKIKRYSESVSTIPTVCILLSVDSQTCCKKAQLS